MMLTKRMVIIAIVVEVVAAIIFVWLIETFQIPIFDFIWNSPCVLAVRMGLIIAGALLVTVSVALGVAMKCICSKHTYDRESDIASLYGFAIAMMLILYLYLFLFVVGCDAGRFKDSALLCLGMFGSIVAIRIKRWGWIVVYVLLFLIAGSIFPAA